MCEVHKPEKYDGKKPVRKPYREIIFSPEELLNSIANKKVKDWYNKHIDSASFFSIVNNAKQRGYNLDPNSGLFFRFPYSEETINKIGRTIIDIIFPRPTDFHYHEDVDEALYVVSGEGAFCGKGAFHINQSKEEYSKLGEIGIELSKGDEIYIPKKVVHTLGPHLDDSLEIRLVCSGIFDPKKEVCISPFDEYAFWPGYYDWPDYYDKRDEMEK